MRKSTTLLFLTSGFGDNLLTLPLALELEEQRQLTCVVVSGLQAIFFARCLPYATCISYDRTLASLFKILCAGMKIDTWIYPIGACTRKLRLLHLFSFFRRAIGFTSLVSRKAWQVEIGLETCLMPDLAKRAWLNNLRLLTIMGLKTRRSWDDYARRIKERLGFEEKALGRLIIHAGSAHYAGGLERYKRWPLERFKKVADELLKKLHFKEVYWVLGPDDREIQPVLNDLIKDAPLHHIVLSTIFNGSLLEMGAFLSTASYMLTNDSGLAHLASFFDVPLTALSSGLGQPSYTGQNGRYSQVIIENTPCYGCCVGISEKDAQAFECEHAWACMDRITVERVTKSICEHAITYGI